MREPLKILEEVLEAYGSECREGFPLYLYSEEFKIYRETIRAEFIASLREMEKNIAASVELGHYPE